jgi:hypothetical protein
VHHTRFNVSLIGMVATNFLFTREKQRSTARGSYLREIPGSRALRT